MRTRTQRLLGSPLAKPERAPAVQASAPLRRHALTAVLGLAAIGGGCGGNSGGGEAPATVRAAGSVHRFTMPATACAARLVLEVPGERHVLAEDASPTTEVLVEIPDAVGETGQLVAESTCVGTGERQRVAEPFVIGRSEAISTYRWDRVTNEPGFPSMDGAGAVVHNGRMWLIGGWNPRTEILPRLTSNAVWSSVDGATWELVKPNTYDERFLDLGHDWEGRHTAGYAVLGGQVVIAGGDAASGKYQPDVWSSSDGSAWQRKAARSPMDQRLIFQTFAHDNRICVFGGQTIPAILPGPAVHYDDLWCTLDGQDWRQIDVVGPRPFQRSGILGEAVLNGEVWILGGGEYQWPPVNPRRYNDVWKSRDLISWTRVLESAPWQGRIYHNVAAFDGRLWVIAGYDRDDLGDAWYSKDGFNWYRVDVPWHARHAASVFVHAGALWLAAGIVPGRNEVWRLRREDSASR